MSKGIFDTGLPFNAISLNSGIVVYGIIIKRPFKTLEDEDQYENGRQCIELEKKIYQCLANCDGVIPYLDLSGPAIQLPLISDGTLHRYLRNNTRPTRARQLAWVKEMASTLSRIHDRRVLVVDVASRNMLVHPNGSIIFCDFGTSILLPMETDIWTTAEYFGFSFETDICELGAVMYEVVTGQQIAEFDQIAEKGGGWPPRDKLHSTRGIWLGTVIEACWTKGRFRTTYELCQMLDEARSPNHDNNDQIQPSHLLHAPNASMWVAVALGSSMVLSLVLTSFIRRKS